MYVTANNQKWIVHLTLWLFVVPELDGQLRFELSVMEPLAGCPILTTCTY